MHKSLIIRDILQKGWEALEFQFFRTGVDICTLVAGMPEVALLKYAPGAKVPRHRHMGLETILVLSGTQSDEFGTYPTGSFIANPAGSEHSVWSETGCVVLIQWEKPVKILDENKAIENGNTPDA